MSQAASNTVQRAMAVAPLTSAGRARRAMLRLPVAAFAAGAFTGLPATMAFAANPSVEVWKTPNCGCCREWVAHLQKNRFEVVTHDVKDTGPVREKLGLPHKFGSCHTAKLGDYVLEGHVPAQEIRRLLREKPDARGLAVPGMPVGSPGMEVGSTRDAYNVLLVLKNGESRIYQSYSSNPSVKT